MSENKITELINLYFDGELDKGRESFLFTELSQSPEGREYFKQLSRIKSSIDESLEDFPEELDERILRSVSRTSEKKSSFFNGHRIFAYVSYAVAVLLIVLSGYLFMKVSTYQEKVDNLSQQMNFQTKTIQMLFNSLPGFEVIGTLDNKIIIRPNI
ncbi:MAG TPA: hypothetical protein VK870_12185 [Ignavibacteriaceae bacterium]|nr:hypothetical protein [Ignavibacteriaceae bacterium]